MEPGLQSLIFASKFDSAKKFQDWVFSNVVPSIRKYGYYKKFDTPNELVYKIENDYDLHTRVVQYIRKAYPEALLTPGQGEFQGTSFKRNEAYEKG